MAASNEIKRWRRAQRSELLARRMSMTAVHRRDWSRSITDYLINDLAILRGVSLGTYWPIRGEFDLRPAIRALHAGGTRLALPVIVQKDAPLEFREWWPGVRMTAGLFGIPVPYGTQVIEPRVLLIPPVGFDMQGFRLGYGGGYYDRTLAAATAKPLKIALAFELSRITTIRPQSHDVAMDFIVTETGIHPASASGLRHVTASGIDHLADAVRPYASPACFAHECEVEHDDVL